MLWPLLNGSLKIAWGLFFKTNQQNIKSRNNKKVLRKNGDMREAEYTIK
jgi:hypothetical protein